VTAGDNSTIDGDHRADRDVVVRDRQLRFLERNDHQLAVELGEHRIRVNVITPGWIMTQRQIDKWLTPEGELEIKRNQVLPDKVRPEDVAPMALFLASDDARACSAQEYIVDAGWL